MEKEVSVGSFSNRYGFPPVLVDLREGVGKGRKKKSKADYYPELFSPFLLHHDGGSLPAPAVCSRLRDRVAKILTTQLRL